MSIYPDVLTQADRAVLDAAGDYLTALAHAATVDEALRLYQRIKASHEALDQARCFALERAEALSRER